VHADITTIIEQSPAEECPAQAYRLRGWYHAGRQEWKKALADFTRVREREPSRDIEAELALVHFALGDTVQYQKLCKEQFDLPDPGCPKDLVRAWAMRESGVDAGIFLQRARHNRCDDLAVVALYRAGNYREALQASEAMKQRDADDELIRAMILYRLNRVQEAEWAF